MPFSSMNDKEKDIIKLLKVRPYSVSQLATKLNMRRDFLTGYLESMKDRGMLKLIKVGKANVYQVSEKRGKR